MRYECVTSSVEEIYNNVRREYFPELRNVNILILLDTKKRQSKGKLILASIKKASDVERYLSDDSVNEGYDYVMFVDKQVALHCEPADLERIIRHELRHIFITERGKLSLQPHDFEDFIVEVDINHDDPRWAQRVAEMVSLIHEQNEDQ